MEKQFSELSFNNNSQENPWDDMNVEQAICTKAVRHKSNKSKSLTQSKKEIISSHEKGNWAANNGSRRFFDWKGS